MKHVEELLNIPQHLKSLHRREVNLLWYGPSRLFGIRQAQDNKNSGFIGVIRIAMREHDAVKHGLMTDLTLEDEAHEELAKELIAHAEEELKKHGATKIDAVVLDGDKRTHPFQESGYWPQRKTVVIEWDLGRLPASAPLDGIAYEETDAPPAEEAADFILSSYQPYWRWWKNDLSDRPWERIDYPAAEPSIAEKENLAKNREKVIAMLRAFNKEVPQRMILARKGGEIIGLCDAKLTHDEQFDWGVLMKRDHPGAGFGTSLLIPMLQWLKDHGRKTAEITTTSGMDDFDPTVYLYVQSCGGAIRGEFINLVKRKL
ncbi:MAG: GNAT family N-acetyltransferase [Patescibacteria group bacterium]|jgi:GNAT superfamily N-acetyltransferase